MKATIDIPDELYRRVKARSALLGRAVRDVTIELYQRWLTEPAEGPSTARSQEEWLNEWLRLGNASLADVSDGPTVTEILAADRERLDRP